MRRVLKKGEKSPPGWTYAICKTQQLRQGDYAAIFSVGASVTEKTEALNNRAMPESTWDWDDLTNLSNPAEEFNHDIMCIVRLEGLEFNEDGEVCP